jgi:hypothetical protein
LPLAGGYGFTTFSAEFGRIVELFVNIVRETAAPTLHALLAKFPISSLRKTVEFLRLMPTVISHLSFHNLTAEASRLFSVLANCASTGQTEVVSAALEVWQMPDLEALMKETPKIAVGIAYPLLSKAQSECYSPAGASLIGEMLQILSRANRRSREQMHEMAFDASPAALVAWAKVVKVATAQNSEFNLQEIMRDLQRRLNRERLAVALKKLNTQRLPAVRAGSQPAGLRTGSSRSIQPF